MVYFLQAEDGGAIKVGYAAVPRKRLKQLQTASSVPLRLLRTIKGGRDLETALHVRFAPLRTCGEWFRPGTDLTRFIEDPRPELPSLLEHSLAVEARRLLKQGFARDEDRQLHRVVQLIVTDDRGRRRRFYKSESRMDVGDCIEVVTRLGLVGDAERIKYYRQHAVELHGSQILGLLPFGVD